jgi:hypothetical protein
MYLILIDGREIDHASTIREARNAANTIAYGGLGTPAIRLARLWCNGCQSVTRVADWDDAVRCERCGDDYGCAECGADVARDGTCLRSETLGEPCPGDD